MGRWVWRNPAPSFFKLPASSWACYQGKLCTSETTTGAGLHDGQHMQFMGSYDTLLEGMYCPCSRATKC